MNPESGFNLSGNGAFSTEENRQQLLIPSSRYEFFRIRRLGMVHFAKQPSAEKANDLLVIESLRKEFLIGYSLNHPGIARYLHFENNCVYEEYIEGKTLRQIIDEADPELIDKSFVISISRQLLEAVGYIHSKGVLHLDIKPENLIVTGPGTIVKLIDFSCARSSLCDSTPGFTPGFMAPEQNADTPPEAPTDIYLAGKTIRMLAEAAGIKSLRLKRFISRATDEEPSKRYQSAEEALKALPSSRSTYLPWLITTLVLVFCLIFTISLTLFRKPETRTQEITKSEIKHDTIVIMQEPEAKEDTQVLPPPVVHEEIAPAPEVLVAASEPLAKIDAKDVLAKDIEKYVTNYFKQNIYPVFNDTIKYPGGVASTEFRKVMQNKMQKAYDDIMSYGARLRKQNPNEETFIDTNVMMMFAGQSNHVDNMMEP